MISKVLFMEKCTGYEPADALRKFVSHKLEKSYEIKITDLERTFTFVTDCTATMPAFFGASVSSDRFAYYEILLGCVSYQLNKERKKSR